MIQSVVNKYQQTGKIPTSFQVLGASSCQGQQTIPRAEMQAVLTLIQQVETAPDSSYVVSQVEKLGLLLDKFKYHKFPNFDLLSKLWDRLQIGDFTVGKVKAHDINLSKDDAYVTFCKLGNQVADGVAKQMRLQFEKQCPVSKGPSSDSNIKFAKLNLEFRYHLQVERTKLLAARQQTTRPMLASKSFQDQLRQLCPEYDSTWSFRLEEQD